MNLPLQDWRTFRAEFNKLRDECARSTVKVSALTDEAGAYQNECDRLRDQVAALQQELRVQNERLENRVASLTSVLHAVRINVEPSSQ